MLKSASDDNASEEDQIRLETDENAVKLITIHRSKGLEYPVVFCPFAWDSSKIKDDQFSFHDPAHDDRLTLDLGSGVEENRIQRRYRATGRKRETPVCGIDPRKIPLLSCLGKD